MRGLLLASLVSVASAARWVVYWDQWHPTAPTDKSVTSGVTHLNTAFAPSDIFNMNPVGDYEPFKPLNEVRALLDANAKVCMAIGGWGDTAGFGVGAASDASRKLFAKNVAATMTRLGYDCVDIDWEYPGGNGEDYKQNPNSGKVAEIANFPLLLTEIKKAIGTKELSIATPGTERDMLAYTAEQVPNINKAVDFVNLMTYDLMNRRDNTTRHHSDLKGSLAAIDTLIARGMEPAKLNLGIAFYAKWFLLAQGGHCTQPIGCPGDVYEDPDSGNDTARSGAYTFEKANFIDPPANMVETPDGSCGAGTNYKCPTGSCCSQYGFCGTDAGFCGGGCQSGWSECKSISTRESFKKALAHANSDQANGALWYVDSDNSQEVFWTWENTAYIKAKIARIVKTRSLGGIMAWSLGEDSNDWSRMTTIRDAIKTV